MFSFLFEVLKRTAVVAALAYAVMLANNSGDMSMLALAVGYLLLTFWSLTWLIKTQKADDAPNTMWGKFVIWAFFAIAIAMLASSFWAFIHQHHDWSQYIKTGVMPDARPES